MVMVESGIILVGGGHGDCGVKSIGLISEGVATITFLGLPCLAPDLMNCLNYVSIDPLLSVASSKMSVAVASNSSSSSDSSRRMSLRFPFPYA